MADISVNTNFDDSRIFSLNVTNATLFLNGENYSEVQFQIPGFIVRHSSNYATYVSIENATLPSSWYVIDSINNTLHIEITESYTTTTAYTITIPPGTYDAYSLLTVINEALPAILTGLATISFSEAQNKFGVSWTSSLLSPVTSIAFLKESSLAFNIGFSGIDQMFPKVPSSTQYFTYQCNLTGVNLYLIKCDELPVQNYSLQVASTIIGSIQNVAGTFGLTTWQNTSDLKFLLNLHRDLDQLTFRIYNERGQLINFNKSPWSLTLKVTYHRKTIAPFGEINQVLHPSVAHNPSQRRRNLKRKTVTLQEQEPNPNENEPEMGAMEGLEPPQF